jgi:hypothetical protein
MKTQNRAAMIKTVPPPYLLSFHILCPPGLLQDPVNTLSDLPGFGQQLFPLRKGVFLKKWGCFKSWKALKKGCKGRWEPVRRGKRLAGSSEQLF